MQVMFLAEAAPGQEYNITHDDASLSTTEPDPSQDVQLTLDGYAVLVPQGQPVQVSMYADSSFSQSEYLFYEEI